MADSNRTTGAGQGVSRWGNDSPASGACIAAKAAPDGNRPGHLGRVICFAAGTGIATPGGERPVQDLRAGDKVFTRDNGPRTIRWIGRRRVSLADRTLPQRLQPIRLRRGALGDGLPERDLLVSPNHRLLLTGQRAQLHFEEAEVLVAARHLVGIDGVEFQAVAHVDYIHFLCDRHEIVLSNGAWTESYQPGRHSLAGLAAARREEIFQLFPELREGRGAGGFAAARRTLKRYEAKLLTT